MIVQCFGPPINPGQGHLSSLSGASHSQAKAKADVTTASGSCIGNKGGWEPTEHYNGGNAYACGRGWKGVMGILYLEQLLEPGTRIVGCQAVEKTFHILVYLLGLIVMTDL